MSSRAPHRALLLAGGLSFAAPASAIEWSFRPAAELLQTYTNNAQRTATGSESDYITEVRASLPLEARGRASRFEFGYWPTYEYFWDDDSLNALSHLARTGWSHEGTRVHAVTAFTYQHSQDPRLTATRPGETPAPGAPAETAFLVERTQMTLADLTALLGFKVGRSTTIETSAMVLEQRYADPVLVDGRQLEGTVGFTHEASPAQHWDARLRASRFSNDELGWQSFGIVEGGGEFEARRGLQLTARLGWIVAASGGVLDELSAGNQLLGELLLAGQSRLVRWSAGVNRDVTTGGGLRLALLTGEATADLEVTLGEHDTLGVSAVRSHSRQPVESGTTLDLTSDRFDLRLRHSFSTSWSASFEAAHLEQESDDAAAGGAFQDDRLSIGVRWTGNSRPKGVSP